ncbi:hypothetical protein BGZ90_003471 [Linnemannia elongata]|nr:hypothetical protein BGZ90_003471 [Linnemannia elongata]
MDNTMRQWNALTGDLESTHVLAGLSKTPILVHELSPDFQKTAYCFMEDGTIHGHIQSKTGAESGAASDTEFDAVNSAQPDATLDDDESDAESEDDESDAESEDDESDAESEKDKPSPMALTFTSTTLLLAVGFGDGTVNIYDTQSEDLLMTTTIEDQGVSALAYSPNDQELAIGCTKGVVAFWDLELEEPGHTLNFGAAAALCTRYSPWEDWFALGAQYDRVHLCRRDQSQSESSDMEASWCVVYIVEGFFDWVMDIAWNPVVRNEFVTGCRDRSVRVWRILEGDNGGDGSVTVELVWGTNIGMLGVAGMRLDGVVGLDTGNRRLLKQRGALGDILAIEIDEAVVGTDGV